MKVRIIASHGYYRPQYKAWFGWNDINFFGSRLFITPQEALGAIQSDLYPEGKVLYEGDI